MKKGFTLMELLVVIAIVAVVSLASTISFSNIDDATSEKELANKYIEIQRAASLYMDLHSDRLKDFVKDNVAYIPLSVLEQEGYLSNDLSDPTGGEDISKTYSVEIVIGGDSVETCIVDIKKTGTECIADKFGKKGGCCSTNTASSDDLGPDYYAYIPEGGTPPVIDDQHTGITKFDKARVVNAKMKSLAKGSSTPYDSSDNKITAFKYATSLRSGFVASEDNTVSPLDSSYLQEISDGHAKPIYIWYDSGTIYFYSEDKNIYLNADGYYMFGKMNALKDITGLSHVNTKNLETLQNFFLSCYGLNDLTPIKSWNVSKVKSMRSFLNVDNDDITDTGKVGSVKSLEPLASWDVRNVIDMDYAFSDQIKLRNLKGLDNWKTNNLKYLNGTFELSNVAYYKGIRSDLNSITSLKKWDTSKVTSMNSLFNFDTKITSLSGLESWNTAQVTDMRAMFFYNVSLTNINALRNWNTGNVTLMENMFSTTLSLQDVSALQSWDVRNVTNFNHMFNTVNEAIEEYKKIGSIRSLAPLSSWEPRNATTMIYMFEDQVKANDYSLLNTWGSYLSGVSSANAMFGLSNVGYSEGFACSNQLANLKNDLTWPTSITGSSGFYAALNNCER